jgi:hypothetical protein
VTLGRLPWVSALALLCALAVAVWAARSGLPWSEAAGLGLTNLGYFLAVAGLATGHFGVLGLMRRWQVFLAATLAWVTGMILVSLRLSAA